MWGMGQRGNNAACLSTHKQMGPFSCWFLGGWLFVHSRILWVSLTNCTVMLGVSPAAAIPTGFFHSGVLRLYLPTLEPWVAGFVWLPVVPPGLSTCKGGTTRSASHRLSASLLHSGCPSPPLLAVWTNVSFLTPWLSDLHAVWFSISSGCFLFLNLLSFIWLYEEQSVCIYLCLHLAQKFRLPVL